MAKVLVDEFPTVTVEAIQAVRTLTTVGISADGSIEHLKKRIVRTIQVSNLPERDRTFDEDYIAAGLIDIAVKLMGQGRREQWVVAAAPAFSIYDILVRKDNARYLPRYSDALNRLYQAARVQGFAEEAADLAEANIAIYQEHSGSEAA
jgi:hypothetical protein